MKNILFVFLGGGLGSILRLAIHQFIRFEKNNFPISTLISNIVSCIILSLIIVLFADKISNNNAIKMFIIIGFCGGLSTFSTFSYETFELIKNGNILIAVLNISISLLTCIGIIYFISRNSI